MPKYIIFILALLLTPFLMDAQPCGIRYSYDNAGNRIKKYYCWGVESLEDEDTPVLLNPPEEEAFTATVERQNTDAKEETKKSIISDLSNLVVFPNPTIGQFSIQSKAFQPDDPVYILNGQGQLITNKLFDMGEFDISDFPSGTYYVVVVNEQGIRNAVKIIRY